MNSLTAVNVTMEEVSYRMKKAIRLKEMEQGGESIAIVNGLHFSNGTIVIELAGSTIPSASPTARGFIGIAFRVQHRDSMRYDCFYLRPKNGRDIDQLRRNHSAQYIAHPSFTWQYLRKEYPGKYESYVDLVDGEWTKIKIQVKGEEAKLFVHNADQPALIINKLHNTESGGGIALWIGQETDGYFRNLKISKH
ncbi:MAG: hypothetical protein WCX28_03990 [Bacteriovoracaceae bacterium]|nr:hypothetical protein [Bacteroidota bacterium]